jgi:hypothetical protein
MCKHTFITEQWMSHAKQQKCGEFVNVSVLTEYMKFYLLLYEAYSQ